MTWWWVPAFWAITVMLCAMFWWPLVLVSWHYWVG